MYCLFCYYLWLDWMRKCELNCVHSLFYLHEWNSNIFPPICNATHCLVCESFPYCKKLVRAITLICSIIYCIANYCTHACLSSCFKNVIFFPLCNKVFHFLSWSLIYYCKWQEGSSGAGWYDLKYKIFFNIVTFTWIIHHIILQIYTFLVVCYIRYCNANWRAVMQPESTTSGLDLNR